MCPSVATDDRPWVALFDLDGTLTYSDTFVGFLAGFIRRHPLRIVRMWRLAGPALRFLFVDRDRGRLKSRVIRALMGGDSRESIDAWAEDYARSLAPRRRFRQAALEVLEGHRAAGDHLVLLSASPDLYVPRIAELLGFERTWCTEIRWDGDRLEGSLISANRRGEEKTRCLAAIRAAYPGLRVVAYGNSASDLDHMSKAERALLVNADAAARRAAAAHAIPSADWP